MPTRNCRLELRLTKSELTDLTRKARKARLTNSAFIRRAIREQEDVLHQCEAIITYS